MEKFVTNLPTLRELDLGHNKLTALPPLSGMPRLEVLVLSHNHMSGHWTPLEVLSNLKRLDLSDNQLTGTIPGKPLTDSTPLS